MRPIQAFWFTADNTKQPNIYDSYKHMTDDEKRERQRLRRLARQGKLPQADTTEFAARVQTTFDRFEKAFVELKGENKAGWITINRQANELSVDVQRIGRYTFT